MWIEFLDNLFILSKFIDHNDFFSLQLYHISAFLDLSYNLVLPPHILLELSCALVDK